MSDVNSSGMSVKGWEMSVLWFYDFSVGSQWFRGTRTKISLFSELQRLLEGALEIQFPWGRVYLSCHNVKFSSPPIPSLAWCLHISFPRVLAWFQLPKGQTGRQEIKIFILAFARIFLWPWANRFLCKTEIIFYIIQAVIPYSRAVWGSFVHINKIQTWAESA